MNFELSKQHHDDVMRSDIVRQKISNTMKKRISEGKMFSAEHRKKISEKLKGNKHSAGHKRTLKAIEATAKSLRKPVCCYDRDGKLIQSFDSVRSAAKWLYTNKCSHLKSWDDLQNRIKESSVKHKFYRDLIWKYK